MAITIDPQFQLIYNILNTDFIGVDEEFISTDENLFFNQLQSIEDRNIIETLPVMETFCGFNLIKSRTKFCVEIPKVTYTYNNGVIEKTIETIEKVTGNSWIVEIETFLGFEELKTKTNELKMVAETFFNKIQKSGLDYTAKADMIDKYICNTLDLMRGIGNTFLSLYDQSFIYPKYTEAYASYDQTGNYTGIPQQLIFPGLIQNIPNLPIEDAYLSNYFNMLNTFLYRLQEFNSLATELDKVTFMTALASGTNYNEPNLTLADLKVACLHHRNQIIELIDAKKELLEKCMVAIDTFDMILKLISTVAIVYNTSTEANNLQKVLLKSTGENAPEVQKAYDFAIDTKWSYSQAEIATGIMVATRKTLNYFDYHNLFELILDKIFEQGVKQYDKITT